MTQPTFRYVEDYIEYIAGYKDINGKALGMFETLPSPIALARYDVKIVDSLANQTLNLNNAYTDKQSELSKKIVEKYKRQLGQLGVIIPDVLDQFRLAIRIVDRTKTITLVGDHFEFKFPYDTKLIDATKSQARKGVGSVVFDFDNKVWKFSLTENNLNWLVAMASMENSQIQVFPEVMQLYDKLIETEKVEYRIEMIETETGFEITNAAESLIDYINTNLGGLGKDNLLTLADNSAVLGYELHPNIVRKLQDIYGTEKTKLILAREKKYKNSEEALEAVLRYATLVNRLPIHVYETGVPKKDSENIVYLNSGKGHNVSAKLLVSMSAYMIGSKKESWIKNAEKIITLE